MFKEFAVGKYVVRFYKTDHVWTCTMTEDMLNKVIQIANPVVEDWDAPILLGDENV
jgi:hypothetical protein